MEQIKWKISEMCRAIDYAEEKHCGQTDKVGKPYIEHPTAVAALLERFANPKHQDRNFLGICAVLHDVAEDTHTSFEEIAQNVTTDPNKQSKLITVLDLLTHRKSDTYLQYIKRLMKNNDARTVKICDLTHNLEITRFVGCDHILNDKDLRRINKYISTLKLLNAYTYGRPTEKYEQLIEQFE